MTSFAPACASTDAPGRGASVATPRLATWSTATALAVAWGLAAAPAPASARSRTHVVVVGRDTVRVRLVETFHETSMVRAECVIPRPVPVVWRVLTDYDHLDAIVPAVDTSRVVGREGPDLTLYQCGRAGLWLLRRGFHVLLRVHELPRTYIGFHAVEGDFRRFEGSWQVAPRGGGTWVAHRVVVRPRFWAPAWAQRRVARALMRATIDGIVRRCLAAPPAGVAPAPRPAVRDGRDGPRD